MCSSDLLADLQEVISLGLSRARRAASSGVPSGMVPEAPAGAVAPPTPSAPVSAPSGNAPREAVDMLRSNPTPTMRKFFDETFGAGAADRALGGR